MQEAETVWKKDYRKKGKPNSFSLRKKDDSSYTITWKIEGCNAQPNQEM